ncbi:MAG: flagellar basal body-associated FliL family protein [Campylobacterota bacterium]|nr:flagellar basal body-associated FliL family protein [Campylobacterota bacterium]
MADEEVKEEGKKKGNPMMIILIVLIVVLLAAVGGGGYLLYSKGVFSDEDKTATAPKSEVVDQANGKEDIGETFKAKIDSLVLNITDAKGRAKLMKLSFTLKTIEPAIEAILEDNKAEIVDSIIRQVSARSSEELLTVGGKAMLKEEMIDEINNILNDSIPDGDEDRIRNSVIDIFFTSFVIK